MNSKDIIIKGTMDHHNKKDEHDDHKHEPEPDYDYDDSKPSRYKKPTIAHAFVIIEVVRCPEVVRNMNFIDPNCVTNGKECITVDP